jgi:hypothetical protein
VPRKLENAMPEQVKASSVAISLFVVTTAAINFNSASADPEISPLFILNGLGYLFFVGMLYLPIRHLNNYGHLVRRILMVYTVLTISLYFVWGAMSNEWALPLGPVDKLIELVLLGLCGKQIEGPAEKISLSD